MATVALLPRGEQMMFPLNAATIIITLVGHVVFGLVLGLAFLKAPRGRNRSEWPFRRCSNPPRSSGSGGSPRRSPIRPSGDGAFLTTDRPH